MIGFKSFGCWENLSDGGQSPQNEGQRVSSCRQTCFFLRFRWGFRISPVILNRDMKYIDSKRWWVSSPPNPPKKWFPKNPRRNFEISKDPAEPRDLEYSSGGWTLETHLVALQTRPKQGSDTRKSRKTRQKLHTKNVIRNDGGFWDIHGRSLSFLDL